MLLLTWLLRGVTTQRYRPGQFTLRVGRETILRLAVTLRIDLGGGSDTQMDAANDEALLRTARELVASLLSAEERAVHKTQYATAAELNAAHARAEGSVKRIEAAQQKEAQLAAAQDYDGAARARAEVVATAAEVQAEVQELSQRFPVELAPPVASPQTAAVIPTPGSGVRSARSTN